MIEESTGVLSHATLQLFLETTRAKRSIEGQLKDLNGQLAKLEEMLADEFIANGIQNVNVDGACVYVARTIYAKPLDVQAMHEGLRACGAGDLVKEAVNSQSLSAWVRELPLGEDGKPVLPEPVKDAIETGERVNVRVRNA